MVKFLASVRFTLILLSLALLAVAAGTILESVTDSHAYAALWIYSNPAFLLLLAGFFVNILLSALRRWPWRKSHLPFLLAHLGLLMVIGGAALKTVTGLQGNMLLLAGTGSDQVLLPGSRALWVDGHLLPLKQKMVLGDLSIELLELAPHSSEQLQLWIKDGAAQIETLPPIPFGESLPVLMPDRRTWTISAHQIDTLDDLKPTPPELIIAQDHAGDTYVCAFDQKPEIIRYPTAQPHSVFAVDGGRDGYVVQATLAGTELYAPVTRHTEALPSLTRLEDNRPRATIRLTENGNSEIIQLTYDPTATALRWPALGHLLRFQTDARTIPYRIRLHDATQENFPGTNQPKSYHATLTVNGETTELAMNHVHQTWDGYRFYLGNLTPSDESSAQTVQLIINRDPTKYLLTYPGGILIGLGTLLLYRARGRDRR